jgi:uncharacterized protein YhbP (UPF0306 family)
MVDVEKIIRDYLPQIVHLSLGTSKDNKPWVCEVHFAYDEDLNLYFRSKDDRRHSQEIAANPQVGGSIVKQHAPDEYPLGVYFEGTATKLESEEDMQSAFPAFQKVLGKDESIFEDARQPDGHKFYKISVASWYVFGKFGDAGGMKYELKWNGGAK